MIDIKYGQSGTQVNTVQQLLNAKGFPCTADGVFGTKTLDAVIAFQKANGLAQDGVVGTQTWNVLNAKTVTTTVTAKPTATASTSATLKGFDASRYQGTINWSEVLRSGIDFVYVKATEGLTINDSEFTSYVSGANTIGIPVGAYHFAHPDLNSASAEANHFLSVIKDRKLELIPCLDLEEPTTSGKMTGAEIETWAKEWIDIVEKSTGKKVLLYTGEWFINEYSLQSLESYPLWISIYSTSKPSVNYVAWQYSDNGHVGGINGSVDLDVVYSHANFDFLKGNTTNKGASPMSEPLVKVGSSGGAVTTLQKDLNELGFNCGVTDGIFGANTETQVKDFQKHQGLTQDGVVGNSTWAAIEKAVAAKASASVTPAKPTVEVKPVSTPTVPTPDPVATPTPVDPVAPVAPVETQPVSTATEVTDVTVTPSGLTINGIDIPSVADLNNVLKSFALSSDLDAVKTSLGDYVKTSDLRAAVISILQDIATNAK